LLARLFEYPGEDYAAMCREAGVEAFADEIGTLTTEQIQELFISVFDWNPATSLDLSWHLYGEEYARGDCMVKIRRSLARYGIAEGTELPDHLTNVLRLAGRMEADEATAFARDFAAPAVAKLLAALEQKKTPFAALLRAVREALPVQAPIPALKVELPVLVGED
jgi:nitrate reductase delta subunit